MIDLNSNAKSVLEELRASSGHLPLDQLVVFPAAGDIIHAKNVARDRAEGVAELIRRGYADLWVVDRYPLDDLVATEVGSRREDEPQDEYCDRVTSFHEMGRSGEAPFASEYLEASCRGPYLLVTVNLTVEGQAACSSLDDS